MCFFFYSQVCERLVSKIQKLDYELTLPAEWKLEQVKLRWAEGEQMRAIQLLKDLIKESGV